MCSIYNAETLEKLITTVHNIHNTTSSHERLFARQQGSLTLKSFYAHSLGLHHYSINSLLFLRTIQDKYIALYRESTTQLHIYTSAVRILVKCYLPYTLVTPSKLQEILNNTKTAIWATNLDYIYTTTCNWLPLALTKTKISLYNSQYSYNHIHNNH